MVAVLAVDLGLYDPDPPAPKSEGLVMLSSQRISNPVMSEIKGRIRNNTGRELKYTDLVLDLYDASGKKVGSVVDNSGNLKPGAVWEFDAVGAPASMSTYKVRLLRGA